MHGYLLPYQQAQRESGELKKGKEFSFQPNNNTIEGKLRLRVEDGLRNYTGEIDKHGKA